MATYETETYNDIRVYYVDELDGGGRTFGQAYVGYLSEHVGPVDRVFEWCSGPAFIGFSLLAHGLCRELDLADVNEHAVDAVRKTIVDNDLSARVAVFQADNLRGIPPDRSWDLVVGNPPHSGTSQLYPAIGLPPIIYMDAGWALHRGFYANIRQRLRPGGRVIIQENRRFSSVEDFRGMIEDSGLVIERVDDAGVDGAGQRYYFVWSVAAEPGDLWSGSGPGNAPK